MARDHARVMLSIWSDGDFKALAKDAQRMYLVLLTQPSLRYCGVLDYLPSRLARLATDETEDDVEKAVATLAETSHVIVDYETSEALIRTYIRHDGLLSSPNMVKAMLKDRSQVISDMLRIAIDNELSKAFQADPKAPGWKGFKAADPVLYETLSHPIAGKGSRKGSGKG